MREGVGREGRRGKDGDPEEEMKDGRKRGKEERERGREEEKEAGREKERKKGEGKEGSREESLLREPGKKYRLPSKTAKKAHAVIHHWTEYIGVAMPQRPWSMGSHRVGHN